MSDGMLTSGQIRAARALLDWRQDELAHHSKVGKATIARIEQGKGVAQGNVSTIVKLKTALEKAGITFNNRHDGIGVEIDPRKRKPSAPVHRYNPTDGA